MMKNSKLQKRHILLILALTVVSVILAIALFFYANSGGSFGQALPSGLMLTLLIIFLLLPILLIVLLFVKRSKLIYSIGFVVIAISIVIISFLLFITFGVSDSRPKLVFTSGTAEKEYDGTALVCDEWTLQSGKLMDGHTAVITVTASRTDAGIEPNDFTVSITDENQQNVIDTYNIEYRPGELKVRALSLSVVTESETKEYDATVLKNPNYALLSGKVLAGQNLSIQVLGERTDAGISENTCSITVTDENNQDVTHNYFIEKALGKLEVTKRKISLSTPSYHSVYDGKPISYKQWSYESDTQVLSGHNISVSVSGSQTDAGVSKNSISEVKITEGTKNVSLNYDITLLEGDLIVTPRKITIRSQSDEKNYDGTPLQNPNWVYASATLLVENQSITVVVSGTRTAVGESANTIAESTVRTADGRDVSFNYEIKLQEGSLVVVDPSSGSDPGGGTGGGLDDSGSIGGGGSGSGEGGGEAGNAVEARVYTDKSGKMYLRYMSFGDYTGSKWLTASDYTVLLDTLYSMNYLTGIALKNAGFVSSVASVQSLSDNYLLPYYLDTDGLSYQIQNSDVKYTGKTADVYSAYYYYFDAENQKLDFTVPAGYAALESAYFEYVKTAYLSVPAKTNTYFQSVISAQGFHKNNADIISAVANYIRNAADYNILYDKNLDASDDVAVNFLNVYKQGVCRHFATAATMLYRALGIPARYVIGFAGDTKKDEWVEFTAMNAHAWVEVYVSGIGWVQVEVTAAGFGEGGSNEGETEKENKLELKPFDVFAPYSNGVVLKPENNVQGFSEFYNKGYRYTAVISGKQTTIGFGTSTIDSFVMYDPQGTDVTNQFELVFSKGKLQLYVQEVSLSTESLAKVYDGLALQSQNNNGYTLDGKLIGGHSLSKITMTGSQTNVGQRENSCEIVIVDAFGNDVTYMYKINRLFGSLTVSAREVTVTAGSASKPYDGIPLTSANFVLSATGDSVALGQGDIITVVTSGSQTDVGKSQNEVSQVKIVNKNGKDVTSNYSVKTIGGWLIVTRF